MGLISGTVYYASLAYSAAALALFLFRTLHLRVEPEVCISYLLWVQDLQKLNRALTFFGTPYLVQVHGVENHGKRKLWLLFVLAGCWSLVSAHNYCSCFRLAAYRDVVVDILPGAGQVISALFLKIFWLSSQERDWPAWTTDHIKCNHSIEKKSSWHSESKSTGKGSECWHVSGNFCVTKQSFNIFYLLVQHC